MPSCGLGQACLDGTFARRPLLLGGLAIFAVPALVCCAHKPDRTTLPRVGLLAGATNPGSLEAIYGELARLGYTPRRNIVLVQRLARPNSDDAVRYAAELAAMDLDLILVQALPYALLVRAANPAMPMVIGTGAGLVCNGFATTMERPGGNTTGMEELPPGLTAKRLELLLTAAPNVRRVGLLSTTPATCGHETQLADVTAAAARYGVTVKAYRATNLEQILQSLDAMVRDGQQGFVNFQGGLSLANRQMIVDFALKYRLPAIFQAVLFAEAGGLMSWAPDQNEQMRVAVRMMDKVLRGARPGNLPIRYPERYFLTLNRTAARQIGVTFPKRLLTMADRVID